MHQYASNGMHLPAPSPARKRSPSSTFEQCATLQAVMARRAARTLILAYGKEAFLKHLRSSMSHTGTCNDPAIKARGSPSMDTHLQFICTIAY